MNIKNLFEKVKNKAGNIDAGIALMLVCAISHEKIVRKIIAMDVKVNDKGHTVLMVASKRRLLNIVRELIAKGAKVRKR